jgi:hypothetical protein
MTVPTGTVQSFPVTRIREDLANVINLLDAYEVPFYSSIGSARAENNHPEWLAHKAPSPDTTNAQIEGDDRSNVTITQPIRYKNFTQILDKVIQVSDSVQAANTAGMKEMARDLMLNGIALKTDIETFITGNYASVAGAAGSAAHLAGAEAWIAVNSIGGTGYAAGGFNTGTGVVAIATDGTLASATEANFKSVIQTVWQAGGKNLNVLVGGVMKQKISSSFTGISTRFQNVIGTDQAKILGAADIYVSDFGTHRIMPDRFTRTRTILILDFTTWDKLWLQPLQQKDLAVNGHSDRKMLWCELTLRCWNELANGKYADVQ